ncbi:kinesin light chain 3 [Plectosphaerella cucumerina]|uniref:Kinesin light chain 3 n=1 Tax=Plectosphaerella cucumerina TaxID=40658 RepID=A0A8K0TDE4_9PEZI|nr:kinesin light chain 3 [Plectosphaerella cucumerina]
MEGLGVAANVIAVVDLSTNVVTLCFQYSKEVASARANIERLHAQVKHLGTIVQAAQRLIEGPQGQSLSTSQKLIDIFHNYNVDLQKLKEKLEPTPKRSTIRRLGLRALKWPFSSKEVDQILSSLKRHEDTIHLGLQINQTFAIIKIQEEVKQLTIQAIENTTITRIPHRIIPFPPDPDFIHRPSIKKKSQLAIEFAHQIHTDKPDTSVFWVHSNSRATFEESYRTLADILALPRRHEKDVDILALICDRLQRDYVSPYVFFLNDRHNNISKQPLTSYLPKSIKGKILVTSRSLNAAKRLVGYSRSILRLSVIEEAQALKLLTKRLEGETDKATSIKLVRALDFIPLAVNQAAAYINRRSPRISVTSYLEKFRKSEKQKDSLLRSNKGDLSRHKGVSNSIVVTWQVTFEQVKREQPSAANLLSLISQFQAQNIPEYILRGYQDDKPPRNDNDAADIAAQTKGDNTDDTDDFENDIDTLRGYSLVTFPSAGFYEMHSLSTYQTLLPHIEALLRSEIKDKRDSLDRARLLIKATWFIRSLGPNHYLTLRARSYLSWTYWELVETTLSSMNILAIMFASQVLEVRKAKLGADHPDTLTSINNRTSTFRRQGRWEEAEALGVGVLETHKAKLGADHPQTVISIHNLASTFLIQILEAFESNKSNLDYTRKVKLGADHPVTLESMRSLAITWYDQGRQEDALDLMQDCLLLRQQKLGHAHADTQDVAATLQRWQTGRRANSLGLTSNCIVHTRSE